MATVVQSSLVSPFTSAPSACPVCETPERLSEGILATQSYRCEACGLWFCRSCDSDAPSTATTTNRAWAARIARQFSRYTAAADPNVLTIGADQILTDELALNGFQAECSSASELPEFARAFQACVLHCALESVSNPAAFLRSIYTCLEPGGTLLITTPIGEPRPRHRHCFTADTLQSLLLRTGFGDPVIREERDVNASGDSSSHLVFFARRKEVFRAVPRLSVIVPVYNECATVATLLDTVLAKEIPGTEIEVIVTESNSTDGSREIVEQYRNHPRVVLILEERPRGKGHAVRNGLKAASGDFVLIQDADLEYDIDDYDSLLQPLRSYRKNFVIGSRHLKDRGFWHMRQFGDANATAALFNLGHLLFLGLFNALYGQRMRDPFSMFKVFRRECLYGLDFTCDRFDFDFEITIKLLRKGYKVLELPVSYKSRSLTEGKKVSVWRDPITWLKALVRFRHSPLYRDDLVE